jgi:tetratricopeptide (TPR) repeat protein
MIRKGLAALIGCVFLISIPSFAAKHARQFKSDLREAEELYEQGQFATSLSRLDRHAIDPALLFLTGRDYYMLGEFKKATTYLKQAVIAAPENSELFDWLGRAYVRRAETSNPLSAPVLSKKAKQAFERAVQLNPKNTEALSDLFDYYLQAPAVLGGGYDKAGKVAEKMWSVNSSEALFEQWKLSQKRSDFRTAEQAPRKSAGVRTKES